MNWVQMVGAAFGALNVVLGIAGAASGSMVSLYAGGAIGVLAIVGAFVAKNSTILGYAIVAIACIAILGRFGRKLMSEPAVYPGGILVVAALITLACLIYGLVSMRSSA
ncbi:MAG: hypothetical protein KF784_10445 [Fimbriimonadaceae bacterium]|nr:hypothetical protein [Fimbriimonadaceae bacterium]